jgi:hypothetical protein
MKDSRMLEAHSNKVEALSKIPCNTQIPFDICKK